MAKPATHRTPARTRLSAAAASSGPGRKRVAREAGNVASGGLDPQIQPQAQPAKGAAFFDIDGTLVRTNVVHAFVYYAWNQATPWQSLKQVTKTMASIPFLWALDQYSRKSFNDIFYHYYRGQSEDRMHVLSDELFKEVLRPAIFPGAADLIAEAKRAGLRTVVVSGALDFTVEPLQRHLGIDDLIANRMEFKNGIATGKLIPPALAGPNKAAVLRDYCAKHGLDLSASYAYSDSYSDVPMLAVVGHPTAVNPDVRLMALARSYQWAVVDIRGR